MLPLEGVPVDLLELPGDLLRRPPCGPGLVAQLHELLTYLGRCGVTTFMVVAQHGIVGAGVESPVDASYLADSVVVLRFFEVT